MSPTPHPYTPAPPTIDVPKYLTAASPDRALTSRAHQVSAQCAVYLSNQGPPGYIRDGTDSNPVCIVDNGCNDE